MKNKGKSEGMYNWIIVAIGCFLIVGMILAAISLKVESNSVDLNENLAQGEKGEAYFNAKVLSMNKEDDATRIETVFAIYRQDDL